MKISIIIPTLNEEATIELTLRDLFHRQNPDEVIVVDGGSSDQTVALASQWTSVISSAKGRAYQMNIGAQHAKGDVYLFLHADTLLPVQGLDLIREVLDGGARAGRFRMRFDDSSWILKWYSFYTRFHFFSYGDQGFFVTKDLFQLLGGFRTDVPFEDIDFYRRLRSVTKPVMIRVPVTTSARRFQHSGYWKQKWINIWLVSLYYLGFNVFRAKKELYPDIR